MATTEAAADVQSKYWRLRRSALLDCLSDGEIRELSELCEVRVCARGRLLYEAGAPSDSVFVVEAGAVKLCRVSADRREITVGVLGPGEIFGERALCDELARIDVAVALEDVVVCRFEHIALGRFLHAHPELALRITRLVGDRLRRVETRIQDILFKDVRTRLAHTVARLAAKFGQDIPEGRRIGLRLTQTDLAQLIGSTRETTSTIFNELRRDGLVASDGHYIVVCDPETLARY